MKALSLVVQVLPTVLLYPKIVNKVADTHFASKRNRNIEYNIINNKKKLLLLPSKNTKRRVGHLIVGISRSNDQ